jgi:predicted Rossmann fold nucleotide-binding protein DprA/Smf involved in DNA uptake
MKTAIVGTRTFNDYQELKRTLESLKNKPTEIISGGARGADALAERYAKENNIKLTVIEANWNLHGKAAGPIRNLLIVEASEQVVAMWNGESKGTENTIKNSKEMHRPVIIVNYGKSEQLSLWS